MSKGQVTDDLCKAISHDIGEALLRRYGDFRGSIISEPVVGEFYSLIRDAVRPHLSGHDVNAELLAAAKRLLVDAQDRGETEDEETDEEYDDWRQLREAVEKAEGTS